jgi:hypothetical protein
VLLARRNPREIAAAIEMPGHVAGTKGPFLMRHVCFAARGREREGERNTNRAVAKLALWELSAGKPLGITAGRHYLSIYPGSGGGGGWGRVGSRGITGVRALIAREEGAQPAARVSARACAAKRKNRPLSGGTKRPSVARVDNCRPRDFFTDALLGVECR